MPKSKTEKHNVLFKGRFSLRKDQICSDIALQVVMKCKRKKKSLLKTIMKIHDNGFHIGHVSGLVNIRKMWFYYKDMHNYYIFGSDRNALILVNCVQNKYFLSYFYFENLEAMDRICKLIEETNAMPDLSIIFEEPLDDRDHISDKVLGDYRSIADESMNDQVTISNEPLENHETVSDEHLDDNGHISNELPNEHVRISDEPLDGHGHISNDEKDGHVNLAFSADDLNEIDTIDTFLKPNNGSEVSEDFDGPSTDDYIVINQQQQHNPPTFFCRSFRVVNLFKSYFNNLFSGFCNESDDVMPIEKVIG